MAALADGEGGIVLTLNVDILRRWVRDPGFRRLTERVTYVVADGMPLLWAARLQGRPLPGRVTGADLLQPLAAGCAERGHSIFLLGGTPGSADACAAALESKAPGLSIAGTRCPPLGFERDPKQMDDLRRALCDAAPDLVLVALGSPKQDALIANLAPALPATWWIGVGGSFSFYSGENRRAPAWMQRVGLEWLHRLASEPGRLWRRYLIEDLPFAFRLLASAMRQRLRRQAAP